MGVAPPVNLPTPTGPTGFGGDVGFSPAPTGLSICGFLFPSFNFSLFFRLPKFPPFPFPPVFLFFLALNCDLSDPFEASFEFGGGRVSTGGNPDDDPEFGTD